MKLFKLYTLFVISIFLTACERDLPYPLDGVTKSVVIDITKSKSTTPVINNGSFAGDYKVKLTIPKQQGDYSMMDYAQLRCVFEDVDGNLQSFVLPDKIKNFPAEIDVNLQSIYETLDLPAPMAGEYVCFTADVILKNGKTIPGWTEYTSFNNINFSGWIVDGRAFSYAVEYPVVCPLEMDAFEGEALMSDFDFAGYEYNINLKKISDTEFQISGFFEEEAPNGIFIMKVDPEKYTVEIEKQMIVEGEVWDWGYHNMKIEGSGTIDACNLKIKMVVEVTVDEGSMGKCVMTIIK